MVIKKAKPTKAPKAKVAVKKAVVKKIAPKKVAVKKAVVKKVVIKKEAPKKNIVKKVVVKKVAVKKEVTIKKPTVKKAVVKKVVVKKIASPKKTTKKKVLVEVKDIKDVGEELVLTKYETGAHTSHNDYVKDTLETGEIPSSYDINRIVILPVDPTFAFIYWEVREDSLNSMFDQFGYDSKLTIRVYDVTNIEFNGLNAHEWWDIEAFNRIGTWYLKHNKGDRNLVVDMGIKSTDGMFHVIHRSKAVYFPRDRMVAPGKIFWMLVDEFGNKIISDIEDFTEEDMKLLKIIMGEERFKRFMTGLEVFLGGSAWGKLPVIENFVDLAKIPSSRSGSGWR
jgi:hypothetical protein